MIERTGYVRGQPVKLRLSEIAPNHYLREDAALAFARLVSAAERAGIQLVINYAFRPHWLQAKLYAEYALKMEEWEHAGANPLVRPFPVAKPGQSTHEAALSIDFDLWDGGKPRPSRAWLLANAASFGFERDVKREEWHHTYRSGVPA